jgi:hypothetical protein
MELQNSDLDSSLFSIESSTTTQIVKELQEKSAHLRRSQSDVGDLTSLGKLNLEPENDKNKWNLINEKYIPKIEKLK